MKIKTKFLGEIEISDKQSLEFVSPIIGFEDVHKYAIIDSPNPPFYYLQSIEDISICFVILSPYIVARDYELDILDTYYEEIGATKDSKDNILVFSIVNIPEDESKTTVNLFAPIIINKTNNLACQTISNNEKWEIKTALIGLIDKINKN